MIYSTKEMLDLIRMHFNDAFRNDDYHLWDWSIPYYLISNSVGWTAARFEQLVDYYHNGPDWVR